MLGRLTLSLALSASLPSTTAAQDNAATMFGGDMLVPNAGGLEVYRARRGGPAPIVIFIQDGLWSYPPDCPVGNLFRDLNEAGIAVLNVSPGTGNLREARRAFERTLSSLRRYARYYQMDLSRIAIVGCGSGAHFAALLGSDPSFFDQSGLRFSALRAVATVRSAGFDWEQTIAAATRLSDRQGRRMRAFVGEDLEESRHMSPLAHTDPPNAPVFLFIEAPSTPEQPTPSETFATLLATSGSTTVQRRPIAALATQQHRDARIQLRDHVTEILAEFLVPLLNSQTGPATR